MKVMIKNNYGKIINISSLAGKVTFARGGAYCASKFGVLGLTGVMASEVKEYNININAVCPNRVDTPMFNEYYAKYGQMDFLMKPEDITKTILFLASNDANAIKGAFIEVANGQNLNG